MSDSHMVPLSELTTEGISEFKRLLVAARSDPSTEMIAEKSRSISTNFQFAKVIREELIVDCDRKFSTRRDVAAYFGELLHGEGTLLGPSAATQAMWSWLGLVYLGQLCRPKTKGIVKIGENARYLLSRDYTDFYRHLIAFPTWVLGEHGENARIYLCQPAFVMPDVVEQIASRFEYIASPGVVALIDKLYWDSEKKGPKAAFTKREANGSPSPGTLRALDLLLSQLSCTYDLRSMSVTQLQDKLPEEFEFFL